jgi:hypothetical protein
MCLWRIVMVQWQVICSLFNVYCTMFGVLGPFTSRVYITCHFWTPIYNMLGYWRHCSVCYTSLFTTPLVVSTVSVYNVLWPSDVVSQEWSFDLSSVICSVISFSVFSPLSVFSLSCLVYLLCLSYLSFFISSLCPLVYLWMCVFYRLLFSSVSVRLSAAPQIGCLRPGKKTPSPTVAFPVAPDSNNLVA